MYVPRHNAIDEVSALRELIELAPLVELVSMTADGLVATALPMLFVQDGDQLILHGHVARANDHWKLFDGAVDSLAIITGPNAYITPNSYPTKAATEEVVPTWNYESVHARGKLTAHDDPAWVEDLVTRLTNQHEKSQPTSWKVSNAPRSYLDLRLRGIVGIELHIATLEAKAKLSQDKSTEDAAGALDHLAQGSPTEQEVAKRMGG